MDVVPDIDLDSVIDRLLEGELSLYFGEALCDIGMGLSAWAFRRGGCGPMAGALVEP
jgi:hypothetical protein